MLNFWGFYIGKEKKEFDNYYSLRGAIAEELLQKILESKGYAGFTIRSQKKTIMIISSMTIKTRYINTLVDFLILSQKKMMKFCYAKLKAKIWNAKKFVDENPPQTEVMQGKILALLYGLDKVAMVWFLFDDDIARKMKNVAEEVQPYDTQKAVKLYFEKIWVIRDSKRTTKSFAKITILTKRNCLKK